MRRSIVMVIMLVTLAASIIMDYKIVGELHGTIKELRATVAQQDLEIQRIQDEYDQYKENYRYISDIVNR